MAGDGRFVVGHVTWNKGLPAWNRGTKGIVKPNKGSFKKGHKSLLEKHTEETKRKIGNANRGRKQSEEVIRKRRIRMMGHVMPEKTRKAIAAGIKKKWDRIGRMSKEERIWQKHKRHRVLKLLRQNNNLHTYGEWEILKKQYDFTCPSCKKQEPEIKLTEDHIIPLSKGGSDSIENIQPLCGHCNAVKHTKIIKF